MNKIFKKIALRIGILFLAVAAAAGLITVIYMDGTYKNEARDRLLRNAEVIESILPSADDRDDILAQIDSIEDMRVTLVGFDGVVIYDSRADAGSLENHADRPEVIEALKEGTGSNIRQSDTLGSDMMYFAYRSEKLQCIIRVSLMLQGVSAYSSSLWIPMLIMLLVAFILCLIIALFVSRSVTRPIIQLKTDTARIAEGRYEELQTLHTGDEIESLSLALCDMAGKLRRNFEDITENNSRLEAVLRAVPGGIIAVDGELRVIMANMAARSMFSMDERPEGRHFLEVTRQAGLEMVIREAAMSAGVVEHELIVPRGMETSYYQVFAAPVLAEGKRYGVILLVQDITHLHKLENLRRDFVANVTHELKTPLTVIRGFVETLKDPDLPRGDISRFLDIIALESERLTRLINDVLLLSEIENIAEQPRTAVDVRDGVREAFQLLQNAAGDKELHLSLVLPETPVMVAAESDRIKQLAINLIDNAVKYTPAGGEVKVALSTRGKDAVLRVEDNGIGIPEANLPRLFERFYRVDTSRSRSLGGTGLGLAIVKHIVNLTGGHIEVDSHIGRGSIFTVCLPLSIYEKPPQ
jgi:two-component system phosphate regulon sensor histidine kinase PhoR